MKKNDIEIFIKNNKEAFNVDLPEDGHETRFTKRLQQSVMNKSDQLRIFYLKIAASILIFLTLSTAILWNYSLKKHKNISNIDLSISNLEFKETKDYYCDQINIKLGQINDMNSLEFELKKSLFNEIKIMDSNVNQLNNELINNPNDERIMKAIIEHYQIKLNTLNQLIESLAITNNNINIIEHENSI